MAMRAKRGEVSDHWVDAGPFRAHLRYLMASGALSVEDYYARYSFARFCACGDVNCNSNGSVTDCHDPSGSFPR